MTHMETKHHFKSWKTSPRRRDPPHVPRKGILIVPFGTSSSVLLFGRRTVPRRRSEESITLIRQFELDLRSGPLYQRAAWTRTERGARSLGIDPVRVRRTGPIYRRGVGKDVTTHTLGTLWNFSARLVP